MWSVGADLQLWGVALLQLLYRLRRVAIELMPHRCVLFLGFLRVGAALMDLRLQEGECTYLLSAAWCRGAAPVCLLSVRLCSGCEVTLVLGCGGMVAC